MSTLICCQYVCPFQLVDRRSSRKDVIAHQYSPSPLNPTSFRQKACFTTCWPDTKSQFAISEDNWNDPIGSTIPSTFAPESFRVGLSGQDICLKVLFRNCQILTGKKRFEDDFFKRKSFWNAKFDASRYVGSMWVAMLLTPNNAEKTLELSHNSCAHAQTVLCDHKQCILS